MDERELTYTHIKKLMRKLIKTETYSGYSCQCV